MDKEDAKKEDGWIHLDSDAVPSQKSGERVHLAVPSQKDDGQEEKRFVSLIRGMNGKLYCLDSTCYHMGGPLATGDIEDLGNDDGGPCIVCPWHKYKVRLDTGERLFGKVGAYDG